MYLDHTRVQIVRLPIWQFEVDHTDLPLEDLDHQVRIDDLPVDECENLLTFSGTNRFQLV